MFKRYWKIGVSAMLASILALFLAPTNVFAQSDAGDNNYPSSPIQMIIPYPPGGATDILFRLFASHAEKHLGKPIVPVNVSGAGATIGSRRVKNADPDGYTILASHDVIATAYLSGVVDYAFDAFDTVALLTETPNILTAVPDKWETMTDFLDEARDNPGTIKYGTNPGSTDDFFIADILLEADLDPATALDYGLYDGTGPILKAILSHEVSAGLGNYTSSKGYYEDGSMVPLAVAYDERLSQLPDVPTMSEEGIDVVNTTSRGIFVPKDTPPAIIEKLEAAFKQASKEQPVIDKVEELGSLVTFKESDDAAAYYADKQKHLEGISEKMQ